MSALSEGVQEEVRYSYSTILNTRKPFDLADEAIRIADVNLNSMPCKAGNTTVVLGSGWPGVCYMRQLVMDLRATLIEKTSNFSDQIGKQVASEL